MMMELLFVCHGNICRSPMAEMIMREIIRNRQLSGCVETASAAISNEEEGNPVYLPAQRELAKRHISCEGKKARQITQNDYEIYDLLIGMEEIHVEAMKRFFHGDPKQKIWKLMDFCGSGEDINDPWYYGHFSETADTIEKGCEALMQYLLKEGIIHE